MNIENYIGAAIRPLTPFTNIKQTLETNTQFHNQLMHYLASNSGVINIVQVGAGGTGGYLAVEILRTISELPDILQARTFYTLVDGDAFEPKNLGRQLCTEDDLGRNKAEMIINEYSALFNCRCPKNFTAVQEYITSASDAVRAIQGRKGNSTFLASMVDSVGTATNIIIDCVDRTTCRKHLYEAIRLISYVGLPAGIFAFGNSNPTNVQRLHRWEEQRTYVSAARNMWYEFINPVNSDHMWQAAAMQIRYPLAMNTSNHLYRQHESIPMGTNTYLISCGNGKFTGQVYWGRYANCSVRPTTITDLFPYVKRGTFVFPEDAPEIKYNPELVLGVTRDGYVGNSEEIKQFIEDGKNGEFTFKVERPSDGSDPRFDLTAQTQALLYDYDFIHRFPIWPGWTRDREVNLTPDPDGNPTQANSYLYPNWLPMRFTGKNLTLDYYHEDLNDEFEDNFGLDGTQRLLEMVLDDKASINTNKTEYLSSFMSVPLPYEVNPNLIDPKVDEEEDALSCADRAVQNVQNIHTNKMAASLAINYFNQILNALFPVVETPKPLVTAGVIFDVEKNLFKQVDLTVDYILDYQKIG